MRSIEKLEPAPRSLAEAVERAPEVMAASESWEDPAHVAFGAWREQFPHDSQGLDAWEAWQAFTGQRAVPA